MVAGAGQQVVGRIVAGSVGRRGTSEAVPDSADWVRKIARAGTRATKDFYPRGVGRGWDSLANKKLGPSLAREEAGRGA